MVEYGVFAVGNAIHDFIQMILPENVLVAFERQVRYELFPDWFLVGHYDLLVTDPEVGLKVVDIKTVNSKAFNFRQRDQDDERGSLQVYS